MKDLIWSGVGTMRRERRMDESDLDSAEAGLGRLLVEMIRATRETGDPAGSNGKIPLREGAFVQAKKMCPVWPFG